MRELVRSGRIILVVMLAVNATALPAGAQEPDTADAPVRPAAPLHLAALQGNVEAVRQHVAAGSDLDQVDAYGSTPLIVATTFGRADAVRALVEGGADVAIGNNEGSTPLHIAAFLGREEIVGILLDAGADRYARNDDGATPFDLAAAPVERDRALLDRIRAGLAPLGLRVDEEEVRTARAAITERLGARPRDLDAVDYRPRAGGDWPVSTPAAEGLEPGLVAELYADAARLEVIRGVLVVRNGRLIGERYFNDGAMDRPALLQSVTKSVTSALVGIALDEGCLESLDQPIVAFFPEVADRITDPRKRQITIRQMLQMRAGYGWEGSDSVRWQGLIGGDYLPLIVDFPLDRDPGTGFDYSNVTSHLLGVVVARACDTDLLSFAREHLFGPIGVEPGPWRQDAYGYRYGHAELNLRLRDMARFGLLYLDRGVWEGRQVVPADWVDESLTGYSSGINTAGLTAGTVGRYFSDVEYGYQWWSARVGDRRFDYAWGHGGQLIVLLHDLDMVVVVLSDPFYRPIREDDESWKHEQANINLVGKFIRSLPDPGDDTEHARSPGPGGSR